MKLELELTAQEVEAILLEYANKLYPGAFNYARVDANYGSLGNRTVLSYLEPKEPENFTERAAATMRAVA